MMRKKHKLGSVYRQKKTVAGRRVEVGCYLADYVDQHGTRRRESTGTQDYNEAVAFLKRRQGEVVTGAYLGTEPDKILVSTLFEDYLADQEASQRRQIVQSRNRIKNHLMPFFGARKAAQVGTRDVKAYIAMRINAGAAKATVNRETEILRRTWRLGYEHQPRLVVNLLNIVRLKEDNVRQGVLDYEGYVRLRDRLASDPDLQLTLVIGFFAGTRLGEMRAIRRSLIDFENKRILLPAETTKNGEGRYIRITGDMEQYIRAALDATPDSDRLFPFRSFRYDKWHEACKSVGLENLIPHDLRRTTANALRDSGVDWNTSKKYLGHKSDSMRNRYLIYTDELSAQAAQKLTDFWAAKAAASTPGDSKVSQESEGVLSAVASLESLKP